MGNSSTIFAGEVQVMSAGTGVFHSEFNHEKDIETHLLQIWILPKEKQIVPRYGQKSFVGEAEENALKLVVSGSGRDGSLAINQDAEIYLGKFSVEKSLNFSVKKDRKVWLQIISGKVSVAEFTLEKGDALAIEDEKEIQISVEKNCEFLLFDL
jgi:redox-sensitive bicupin YhaK (pirin superfamily)